MNVQEASIFWGVSKSWVCRLCAAGRVPSARKINGRWIMHPLAAKPFDRRFKKPTITLTKLLWSKNSGMNNKKTRCLYDCPMFTIIDGLVVISNIHERLSYMYKWDIQKNNCFSKAA